MSRGEGRGRVGIESGWVFVCLLVYWGGECFLRV